MAQNAPRENPLIKLVDERIKRKKPKMRGLLVPAGSGTFFREMSMSPFESASTTTVNIQLGGDRSQADRDGATPPLLRNVPVAVAGRGYNYARYAQMPVELSKSESGKVEITGISKRGPALAARRFEVSPHSGVKVPGSDAVIGLQIWPIEYGDFPEAGGYGFVPYGAMGMYDGAGNFIELLGS